MALALATSGLTKEAAVLAVHKTNNCCLSPEYAMDVTITIRADGKLTLRLCEGYATDSSGCITRRAKVSESVLEAIRAAALARGLGEGPTVKTPDFPVGGGARQARSFLTARKSSFWPFPPIRIPNGYSLCQSQSGKRYRPSSSGSSKNDARSGLGGLGKLGLQP